MGWLYEVPIMDKRKSDDYLTGKATVDLDKEEKNQLRDLESKKVAGSLFLDGEDDVSNVFVRFGMNISRMRFCVV